jgi:hypothetical protein
MNFDCPHLSLAPHWAGKDDRRRIDLVRSVDAIRLRKSGEFETVDAWETIRELQRQSRSLAREIGNFVSRTSIDMPSARYPRPDELVAQLFGSLEHGSYVGLRRKRAERSGDDDSTPDERRLVRAIEAQTRGQLSEGGRKYKLVAGADVAGTPRTPTSIATATATTSTSRRSRSSMFIPQAYGPGRCRSTPRAPLTPRG